MYAGRGALLLASVILGGARLDAQSLPTPQFVTVDLEPYLQPGRHIRVSADAMRRVRGPVMNVHRDTFYVGVDGTPNAVALARLDTLWTRGHALVPSVALGTSVGFTLAAMVCVFRATEGCRGLPVGAATGFALGVIVGKSRVVWSRRYARRDGGPVPVIGPQF